MTDMERYRSDPEYRSHIRKTQNKYKRNRYHTDPVYREYELKKASIRAMERYHTDEEYRNKILERERRNRLRRREKEIVEVTNLPVTKIKNELGSFSNCRFYKKKGRCFVKFQNEDELLRFKKVWGIPTIANPHK